MTEVDMTKASELDLAVIKYIEESESGKATVGELITYVSSPVDLFDHLRMMQTRGLIIFSSIDEDFTETVVKLPCR